MRLVFALMGGWSWFVAWALPDEMRVAGIVFACLGGLLCGLAAGGRD